MKKTNNLREGIWKLSSYGIGEGQKKWSTVSADSDNSINLVLKNMNLFLNHGKTLVENFSLLTNDIQRIIYGADSMAFTIRQGTTNRVRYLRLRFAGAAFFSGEVMCKQCADILSQYIAIDQHSGSYSNHTPTKKPVPAFLSELLSKNSIEPFSDQTHLASIYPLEEMIDECILDNDFPSIVTEVANILSSRLKNK